MAVLIVLGMSVEHRDDLGPVIVGVKAKLVVDANVEVEFVVEARQGCVANLGVVVGILEVNTVVLKSVKISRQLVEIARAPQLASPNWLISTYLVLTFGELLLSPMGLSFVTKVAPPKLKGLMMGGWFAATALGNFLVQVGGHLWGDLPLWQVWAVFVVLCLLSAAIMMAMMRRLEKVC